MTIDAPTGPNNRINPYYAKENHVKLARIDSNRREFFGTIGGVPTVPEAPAIIGVPTIDNTSPAVGQTLSVIPASTTGSPRPTNTFEWFVNNISKGTGSTYTVEAADIGLLVRVEQTATNSEGTAGPVTSASTDPVLEAVPAAPSIPGIPTIAGLAQVGETLTASPSLPVGGEPAPTRTWRWVDDLGAIRQEGPSNTYLISTPDQGKTLTVTQIETNASGVAEATSAPTDIVLQIDFAVENLGEEPVISVTGDGNVTIEIETGVYDGIYTQRVPDGAQMTVSMIQAATTPFVLPVIGGVETEGETLTGTPGLWVYDLVDPGDATWLWDNVPDGATSDTDLNYVLQATDVGDQMRLDETFDGITIQSALTGVIAAGITPPDAIADIDWSLSTGFAQLVDIGITTEPADNGTPITAAEYRVDGGDPVPIPSYTGPATYAIPTGVTNTSVNIEIRFSNGKWGAWSNIKSAVSGDIPRVVSLVPAGGATDVAPDVTLQIVYDQPVAASNETIELHKSTGPSWEVAFVWDMTADEAPGATPGPGEFAISGDTITLQPFMNLDDSSTYGLTIDPEAVASAAGYAFGEALPDPATNQWQSGALTNNNFEFTVVTTGTNETFTIPAHSSGIFDCTITAPAANSPHDTGATATAWDDPNMTITFPTPGTHAVSITGTMTRWRFANGGDRLKLDTVTNCGDTGLSSLYQAFYGCSNMTSFTFGDFVQPGTVGGSMDQAFHDCSSLTSLDVSGWDTSTTTIFRAAFRGLASLTSFDITVLDTSSAQSVDTMFTAGVATDLDPSGWDISNVAEAAGFMSSLPYEPLSTAVYDATLINYAAQTVQTGFTWAFGSSKYTAGGAAATARATLANEPNNWIIIDGGTV